LGSITIIIIKREGGERRGETITRKGKCNTKSSSFVAAVEQVYLQPVLERNGNIVLDWGLDHLTVRRRGSAFDAAFAKLLWPLVLGGMMVLPLGLLRSIVHGFNSRPGHRCLVTLGKLFTFMSLCRRTV